MYGSALLYPLMPDEAVNAVIGNRPCKLGNRQIRPKIVT